MSLLKSNTFSKGNVALIQSAMLVLTASNILEEGRGTYFVTVGDTSESAKDNQGRVRNYCIDSNIEKVMSLFPKEHEILNVGFRIAQENDTYVNPTGIKYVATNNRRGNSILNVVTSRLTWSVDEGETIQEVLDIATKEYDLLNEDGSLKLSSLYKEDGKWRNSSSELVSIPGRIFIRETVVIDNVLHLPADSIWDDKRYILNDGYEKAIENAIKKYPKGHPQEDLQITHKGQPIARFVDFQDANQEGFTEWSNIQLPADKAENFKSEDSGSAKTTEGYELETPDFSKMKRPELVAYISDNELEIETKGITEPNLRKAIQTKLDELA